MRHNKSRHNTFGGVVYLGEFCTDSPMKPGYWASKVAQSDRFTISNARVSKNLRRFSDSTK